MLARKATGQRKKDRDERLRSSRRDGVERALLEMEKHFEVRCIEGSLKGGTTQAVVDIVILLIVHHGSRVASPIPSSIRSYER